MKKVVCCLPRILVVFVAIATAGLTHAAYNFVDIAPAGATWLQVWGVNNKGLVALGGALEDAPQLSWVYDSRTGTFTELPPWSYYQLHASGINEAGTIAGDVFIPDDPNEPLGPGTNDGFILQRGAYTRFAYPGLPFMDVRGISKTGLVTGFADDDGDGQTVGFIYDPATATFTDIAIAGMTGIIPQGIDADGRVVGNVRLEPGYAYDGSPAGCYGFVREPDGLVTLFEVRMDGVLLGETRGRGINDAGTIVGFVYLADGSTRGFIGRLPGLGGFQELSDVELIMVPFPGATDTFISDINDKGCIVGAWGTETEGFKTYVATPVRGKLP